MNTVDVGYLKDLSILQRSFDDYVVIDVSFGDMSVPNGLHNFDNERCYIVKKAELDVYMARKESLEHMNCTPVWDAYNQLKVKFNELESENADLRSKVKVLEDQKKRLSDMAVYWNNRFTSVMTDFGKVLGSNGVEFSVKDIDSDGNWNITIDIPELKEMKSENEKLKAKADDLFKERGVLQAKLVKYRNELDNLDADIDALRNKNRDLEKELKDLKSKTVAEVRYEWKPNCFAMICTMCDGRKQTVSMDSAGDTDEKSTMGSFVCRMFNIPQCKNCKNHRYFTNGGHYCHLPDSKHIIPGMFHVNSLTEEEAEGPACDKFEARKE